MPINYCKPCQNCHSYLFETGTYGGQSCLGEELYNKLIKRKFHSVEYAYFPAFGYVGTLTYL